MKKEERIKPYFVARQKHFFVVRHYGYHKCFRTGHDNTVYNFLLKKTGSSFKSKMARDRASSVIPLTEDTLFVGPRIPDEIRRMIPHLTSIDKALFRKILHRKCAQK